MNISIRPAVITDIDWLVKELRNFSAFNNAKIPMFGDEDYVRKTLATYITDHFFRIAEWSGVGPVGFIAGFVVPHFMNPKNKILSEIFWWVADEYRGCRAGAMLYESFESYGKANVNTMYMALESHSPVKPETLTRRGWRAHEQSFIMEVG
jgi:hypothetical protein